MTKNEISVKDLVELFGGELFGNDTLRIKGFKSIVDGSKYSASFFTNHSLNDDVNNCRSTLLIVPPREDPSTSSFSPIDLLAKPLREPIPPA